MMKNIVTFLVVALCFNQANALPGWMLDDGWREGITLPHKCLSITQLKGEPLDEHEVAKLQEGSSSLIQAPEVTIDAPGISYRVSCLMLTEAGEEVLYDNFHHRVVGDESFDHTGHEGVPPFILKTGSVVFSKFHEDCNLTVLSDCNMLFDGFTSAGEVRIGGKRALVLQGTYSALRWDSFSTCASLFNSNTREDALYQCDLQIVGNLDITSGEDDVVTRGSLFSVGGNVRISSPERDVKLNYFAHHYDDDEAPGECMDLGDSVALMKTVIRAGGALEINAGYIKVFLTDLLAGADVNLSTVRDMLLFGIRVEAGGSASNRSGRNLISGGFYSSYFDDNITPELAALRLTTGLPGF